MNPITRDDLKNELHKLVYSQRIPIAQLCRETGMDNKTINMALKGDVTEITLRRFTAWLTARASGRKIEKYAENRIPKPVSKERDSKIREISWLAVRLKERGKRVLYKAIVDTFDINRLNTLYYEYDARLKREIWNEYKAKNPRSKLWLYDRWDARKWMEMLEHSERDKE
jgi:hypothetical protein